MERTVLKRETAPKGNLRGVSKTKRSELQVRGGGMDVKIKKKKVT